MKKLVVIATGWHFSLHFYRRMTYQTIPDGWEVEFVCVSHRDPVYSIEEKQDVSGKLDKQLYEKVATQQELEQLGWKYMLEPNTIGDWECANQWMAKNDQDFDVMLVTHDDNYIIGTEVFDVVLAGNVEFLYANKYGTSQSEQVKYNDNWLCISNGFILGKPHLRGSFDFFKKELIDMMGGRFDLSYVTTTREGEFDSPQNHTSLGDWNNTVLGMIDFMRDNDIFDRVRFLSNTYRVSDYCIEGERGFIGVAYALAAEYLQSLENLIGRRTLI